MAESQNIMPGGCHHPPTDKAINGNRPKTTIMFKSEAFNTSVSKDYFINPGCFGDDVLIWLIEELQKSGITTDDKPGQEDFGWFFNYIINGTRYCFVLGFRPGDDSSPGIWIGEVEKQCGLLDSIFGGRHRNIAPAACDALHRALSSSPKIHDVRWHDKKTFEQGSKVLKGPEVADLIERFLNGKENYPQEWNDFVEAGCVEQSAEQFRKRCYELDPLVNRPGTPDPEGLKELKNIVTTLRQK